MFSRTLTFLILLTLLGTFRPSYTWAVPSTEALAEQDSDADSKLGFVQPYDYERKAYGYDSEGVEYKENQAEDFQVIFITATPFSALFSFGVTGFVSLLSNNSFGVGGDYFLPFLAGTLAGSTTIACVSVLTNKYPPPADKTFGKGPALSPSLAFQMPLLTAHF